MSETVIKNINNTVGVDDHLYILGDLMLNDNEYGRKLLAQIKCPNIHVVLGNHDTDERMSIYVSLWNIIEIAFAGRFKHDKFSFVLSHYPMITSNTDDDNKKISQRTYCLCGHTHTKDRFVDMKKGIPAYHVELDAHDNKPVSIDEIIDDIRNFYTSK